MKKTADSNYMDGLNTAKHATYKCSWALKWMNNSKWTCLIKKHKMKKKLIQK